MRPGRFISLFLVFILLVSGCDVQTGTSGLDTKNTTVKIPFQKLDENSVEWITMTGGLGNITTKVLFYGHDDMAIQNLVSMINESREMIKTDNSVIDKTHSRVRPIGMIISLKENSRIYLWPSYEVIGNSGDLTISTHTDRYVLEINGENGTSEYYTIFSKDVAGYLIEGWKEDMPLVDDIKIESEAKRSSDSGYIVENGDLFTISGDGCPNDAVNIYICKNEGGERCHLGRAETTFGAWEWKGLIGSSLNSTDGKTVNLESGLYDIIVNFGDMEKSVCGIIYIAESSD